MKKILFMLLIGCSNLSIAQSHVHVIDGSSSVINVSAVTSWASLATLPGSAPTPTTVISSSTTPVAAAQWRFAGQQNANTTVVTPTGTTVTYSSDWIFGLASTPQKETIACGWGLNKELSKHAGVIFKLDHNGNQVWNVDVYADPTAMISNVTVLDYSTSSTPTPSIEYSIAKNDLWAIAKANDGYVAVGRGNGILIVEVDNNGNFLNGTPIDIIPPLTPDRGGATVLTTATVDGTVYSINPLWSGYSVAIDPTLNSVNSIVIGASQTYPPISVAGIPKNVSPADQAGIFTVNYRSIGLGTSGTWSLEHSYYTGNDVQSTSNLASGSSINKILTKSTTGGGFEIYACGEISQSDDDQTVTAINATPITSVTPTPSSVQFQTFNKDIWVFKMDNAMTSISSSHYNKSNITISGNYLNTINSYTYPYSETGPLTARNMDAYGNIKFVWNDGTPYASPATQYLNFNNNKNSAAYDMTFTDDGNLAVIAGVNIIGFNPKSLDATGANIVLSNPCGCLHGVGNGAAPNFNEYADCDGFLLKLNITDLSLAGAKNVGHFSGTDMFLQVREDLENNFIIAGSTSDNYSAFGGAANYNLMPDPGFNATTNLRYDKAFIVGTNNTFTGVAGQNDLWRRSYLATDPRATQTGPGTGGPDDMADDMMCVFALELTADGGFMIGGNNSKNGDDFTITKFAPVHQAYLVMNTTSTGYTNFAGGYGGDIPVVHTVSGTETWNASKNIASKVVVPSGATLSITAGTYSFAASDQLWDYASMPNALAGGTIGCGIVVQPGGTLTVSSGVILQGINATMSGTVVEHNVWDGIVVQGTPSSAAATAQGKANLTGVTIKDARYGLFVADNYRNYTEAATNNTAVSGGISYGWTYGTSYNGTTTLGGGIVTATSCNFIDCYYGANFENYIHTNGSSFTSCNFNSDASGMGDICFYTDATGELLPSNTHVAAWAWQSLSLLDNTFTCSPVWAPSVQPTGVVSTMSGLNITSGSGTGNNFTYLSCGVYATAPEMVAGMAAAVVKITNNTFDNSTICINAGAMANNLIIQNNHINVNFIPYNAAGIVMAGCHGYDVSGNTFEWCGTCSGNYGVNGIVVNNGTTANETINNNTFGHIYQASTALQNNGDGSTYGTTGLQYRCNIFQNSFQDIGRNSVIIGAPNFPATMRYEQGHYNTTDPTKGAGNEFIPACTYSGSTERIDGDGYTSQYVYYYNNSEYSQYDPEPCFSNTVTGGLYINIADPIGYVPSYSVACTPTIDYTNPSNIAIWGNTLSNLDVAMAASPAPSAYDLTELQAEHDQTVGNLVRQYTLNNDAADAAALLAGYNMYRDALPFYLAVADYTDAQTMLSDMPLISADDTLYAWEMQLAINLYNEGQTWFNLDTITLDSLSSIVQYNSAAGYLAGSICALLGKSPVTWPVPLIDSAAVDSADAAATAGGGGGGDRRSNTGTPSVTNTNSVTAPFFSLFPNPNYGNITVKTSCSGRVVIYTLLGQQLQEYIVPAGIADIQLPAALSPGIYMANFKPDAGGIAQEIKLVYQP